MTDKVKVVLAGFTKLSAAEKAEFMQEVGKYSVSTDFQKGQFNEQLRNDVKRVLGPTSSDVCTCCGR